MLDVGGSGNQATRDFIRLCELQRLYGYNIFTVDRWHPEDAGKQDHHLSADFREPRRYIHIFIIQYNHMLSSDRYHVEWCITADWSIAALA